MLCIFHVILSLVQSLGRGAPGSVVGIVTRLLVWQFGVQILPAARHYSVFFNVQTDWGSHPTPYSMGTTVLSRGVKRPRREIDHSPASTADATNDWSCTSFPFVCIHDVDRDKFTLVFNFCLHTWGTLNMSWGIKCEQDSLLFWWRQVPSVAATPWELKVTLSWYKTSK